MVFFFFFKQKTAYEMRISDWSSDVCSSDLTGRTRLQGRSNLAGLGRPRSLTTSSVASQLPMDFVRLQCGEKVGAISPKPRTGHHCEDSHHRRCNKDRRLPAARPDRAGVCRISRSEERRVGTACVSTWRVGWALYPNNKKKHDNIHSI